LAKLRPQYRKKSKPYSRLGIAAKKFTSVRALLADRKRQTSISFTRTRFSYKKFLIANSSRKPAQRLRPTKIALRNSHRLVKSSFNGKLFFRFRVAAQQPKTSTLSAKRYNSAFIWFLKSNVQQRTPLKFQGFHSPSQLFNESPVMRLAPTPHMPTLPQLPSLDHSPLNVSPLYSHLHLLNNAPLTTCNLTVYPAFSESAIADNYQTWVMFSRLSQNLRFKQEVLRNNVIRLGRTREVFQFFNYHSLADLQSDKRVKILIPDLNATPRGSFWSSLTLSASLPKAPTAPTVRVTRPRSASRTHQILPKVHSRRLTPRRLRHRLRGVWKAFTRHLKFRAGRTKWLLSRWKRRGRRTKRKVLRRKKGAFKQLRRFPFFLIARRRRNQRLNKFSQSALNSPKRRSISRHPSAFYSEHEKIKSQLSMLSRNPLHSPYGKLKFLRVAKAGETSPVWASRAHIADKIGGIKIGVSAPGAPSHSAWTLHLNLLSSVWLNPLFFKYLTFSISEGSFQPTTLHNITMRLQSQLQSYVFGSGVGAASRSNLWVAPSSNYVIRKKLLRSTSYSLFSVDLSLWYYKSLTSFIEDCSGRKVALRIGPFLEGALTFEDRAYCSLWGIRVTGFQRMLGHKIFAHEALMLVALSFRLKDPTFLANWIRGMLKRLSFWKYRLIFRYLKFLFQHIFRPNFRVFGFRGLKLRLKGKISVAGNARTRTLFYKVGDTSHSKMDNKVAYDLSYVNTFTGIMGFKLWFFY